MAKRKSPVVIEQKLGSEEPEDRNKAVKRAKVAAYQPTDEFQQVTNEDYILRHRVHDLGYGADVFAQDHVRVNSAWSTPAAR
jgi:hypothetical protein